MTGLVCCVTVDLCRDNGGWALLRKETTPGRQFGVPSDIMDIPITHGVKVKVTQSCPTLCDPVDYTVHRILQVRILEWVAFLFSRDLPNPGIKPRSPTWWADSLSAEPQGKPLTHGERAPNWSFFFFTWSIIALQCCVGFCYTTM